MTQMRIIYTFLFFVLLIPFVSSVDVWDRPVFVFNETALNNTLSLLNLTFYSEITNLQNQIDDERAQRIANDSYLQSQINNTQLSIIYLNNSIQSVNNSLSNYCLLSDFTILNSTVANLTTIVNNLNTTIYQVNASIKQPRGQYLPYNSTNFWVNESLLNTTINTIAKNRVLNYTFTVSVVNATAYAVSNTSIGYLLTNIRVTPSSNTTKYRFESTEYPSLLIIDKDRIKHTGVWDIEKNYALNSSVDISITESTSDETFIIVFTYVTNGVQ